MTTQEENHDFDLSAEELDYLKQLVSNDEWLARLFRGPESERRNRRTIRLRRTEAEQLRAYLTERLAKVGFDKDYRPTAEGRLLEELIDRFFVT